MNIESSVKAALVLWIVFVCVLLYSFVSWGCNTRDLLAEEDDTVVIDEEVCPYIKSVSEEDMSDPAYPKVYIDTVKC